MTARKEKMRKWLDDHMTFCRSLDDLSVCAICGKEIEGKGVIYDNEEYHLQCALKDQDSVGTEAEVD